MGRLSEKILEHASPGDLMTVGLFADLVAQLEERIERLEGEVLPRDPDPQFR